VAQEFMIRHAPNKTYHPRVASFNQMLNALNSSELLPTLQFRYSGCGVINQIYKVKVILLTKFGLIDVFQDSIRSQFRLVFLKDARPVEQIPKSFVI